MDVDLSSFSRIYDAKFCSSLSASHFLCSVEWCGHSSLVRFESPVQANSAIGRNNDEDDRELSCIFHRRWTTWGRASNDVSEWIELFACGEACGHEYDPYGRAVISWMSSSGRHTVPRSRPFNPSHSYSPPRDRTRPSIGMMMMIHGSVTSTALPTHGVAACCLSSSENSEQANEMASGRSKQRPCMRRKGLCIDGIEFSYDDKSSPAMNGWERTLFREPN